MIDKNKKILIIGLGLIGGSYAEGLTLKGYEVGAIDKSVESIQYALNKGIIHSGQSDVKKEYVSQFDIVIFALYPLVFVDFIKQYKDYFKENAILSDVSGIKEQIVYTIQDMLPESVEFISAHPMAGKEVYGVINADCKIFNGANYIVVPTSKNTINAINVCKDIAVLLNFKNIVVLSPHEHDEMVAFLSQLTHCIAVSLMTCKESKHLAEYTGDSFRDLTRIANINEDMWTELFLLNKDELISQMDLFLNDFKKLKDAISNSDEFTIKEMMRLSSKRRSYFNK